MSAIPVMSAVAPAACQAPRPGKTAARPATAGSGADPSNPAESGLKPVKRPAEPPSESGSGGSEAAAGVCVLVAGPPWRVQPLPEPIELEPAPPGEWRPFGGKGMPPRWPGLPVELPSPAALPATAGANGAASAAGVPAAATPSTPDALAQAAALAAQAAAAADENPAPAAAPGPDAGVVAAPESAAARDAREVVGRLPQNGGLPPFPVMPPMRGPGDGAPSPRPAPRTASAAIPVLERAASGDDAVARLSANAPVDVVAQIADGTLFAADAATSGRTASAAAPSPGIEAAAAAPLPPAAAPSAQATAPAVPATPMHLPELVGSEEWAEAVAQKLGQLTESPHSRASIRLNPPQLGPLQIDVRVDGDRAVVSLAVHHDAAREALEQAMPRLRAQLEDNGFASIDVSVSHNPHRERPGGGEAYLAASLPPEDELSAAPSAGPVRTASAASRLVDAYA